MTRVSLAGIIADELATLRRFDPGDRPRGKPRRTVWSERLPGFGKRYYSTGRSTYVVQALMGQVTRTITLGNANVLSKSQALTVARRILLRAQVGEDPATKRKQIRKVPNYDDFLSMYWKQAAAKWKQSTLETHNGYRRKHLDRAFFGMFIDEIEQADVLVWFNKVSINGGPGAGNRCFEILRSMFNYAERWGMRPEGTNPCTYIRPNKRRKCERFLSNQEIGRLGEVLARMIPTQPLHATIIYLLLLTGCRMSEIVDLTWSEVKGRRLLLHDSKTGPRTVWLGDEARMLLASLERRSGSDLVFWNKLSLGYRIISAGNVTRGSIAGSNLEWASEAGREIAWAALEVPPAAVFQTFACYDGVAYQHWWIQDPQNSQNPRRAVFARSDPGLATLTSFLGDQPMKQARDLEFAVSWLLWLLGFSPAHLGANQKMSDAADILVSTPQGHFAAVECTTGVLKAGHKLSLLVERTEVVREALRLSNCQHFRVLAVIVTTKTRDEVRGELDDARKAGIVVITRNELPSLIERTLLLPNADQLFLEAEQSLREPEIIIPNDPELPLTA